MNAYLLAIEVKPVFEKKHISSDLHVTIFVEWNPYHLFIQMLFEHQNRKVRE